MIIFGAKPGIAEIEAQGKNVCTWNVKEYTDEFSTVFLCSKVGFGIFENIDLSIFHFRSRNKL